jgi:class 3 adenylate cyclase
MPKPSSDPQSAAPLVQTSKRWFVGRTAERRQLTEALAQATGGNARLVMLLGEPGIGKTLLSEWMSDYAISLGDRVVWGRCWAHGAPPYWPWIQIFRELLSDRDFIQAHPGVEAAIALIERLFPDLRFPQLGNEIPAAGLRSEPAPKISKAPATERFAFFETASGLLKRFADVAPLVVVIDDLHLADADSIQLLSFLARDFARSRILVLATCREEWSILPLERAAALGEVARQGERIDLKGLTNDDVAEFMRHNTSIEPNETLVSSLLSKTAGNPLFLDGITRRLADGGALPDHLEDAGFRIPPTIVASIEQRSDSLSPVARNVLRIAAVVEEGIDVSLIAMVSGLPESELANAIEEASDNGLLVSMPDGSLRFNHGLVAESVRAGMTKAELRDLHNSIARTLEQLYGANLDPHLARLAFHCVEALPICPESKAIDFTCRAAARASAQAAYGEAVRLYQIALRCASSSSRFDPAKRCALLVSLGEAQGRDGDPRALETFQRAVALARKQKDVHLLGRAIVGLSAAAHKPGFADNDLIAALEQSLAALDESDHELRARTLAQLSLEIFWSDNRERAISFGRLAVEAARQAGSPSTIVWTLRSLHLVLWGPENHRDRLSTAEEIIRLAERYGEWDLAITGYEYRIGTLLEGGRIDEVERSIEACSRMVERNGIPTASVPRFRCMFAMLSGDFDRAEAELQKLQAAVYRRRDPTLQITFAGQFGQLRGEQGRLDELEPLLKEALRTYPGFVTTRCGLALLYARSGRMTDAKVEFEYLAVDGFSRVRKDWNWLGTVALLSEVAATLADTARCAVLYALLEPYAGRIVTLGFGDVCYGPVDHYLGLLAGAQSQMERAEKHFKESIDISLRMSARPLLARTYFHFAGMLLSRGGPSDIEKSRALLGSAEQLARRLGMLDLARKVTRRLSDLNDSGRGARLNAREMSGPPKHDGDESSILATLLFIDIASSTESAVALGNRRWAEKLAEYYRIVREKVELFGGREVNTAGDGFLVQLESPARAVRCAADVQSAARERNIETRLGIHTGECRLIGNDLTGVAVHVGARVASLAKAGEIAVSSTVRDLLVGSDFVFQDRGLHTLKGLPEQWRIFLVQIG